MKQPTVYIMTNQRNGTLYTGVTSNLIKRVYEHKSDIHNGFSKKYGCKQLVFYELYETMEAAILILLEFSRQREAAQREYFLRGFYEYTNTKSL